MEDDELTIRLSENNIEFLRINKISQIELDFEYNYFFSMSNYSIFYCDQSFKYTSIDGEWIIANKYIRKYLNYKFK